MEQPLSAPHRKRTNVNDRNGKRSGKELFGLGKQIKIIERFCLSLSDLRALTHNTFGYRCLLSHSRAVSQAILLLSLFNLGVVSISLYLSFYSLARGDTRAMQ